MKLKNLLKLFIIMFLSITTILVFNKNVYAEEINNDDVESITYTPATTHFYYENKDGEWEKDANNQDYYKYGYWFENDDKLKIKLKNNEEKNYTYKAYDEYQGFYNDNDELLEPDVWINTDQETNHWYIGGENNYYTLNYKGIETKYYFEIKENPIKFAKFIPSTKRVCIENIDGEKRTTTIWNETTQQNEEEEYFEYFYEEFIDGDKLEVEYKDENKGKITYTYNYENRGFYDSNGNKPEYDEVTQITNQHNVHWEKNKENFYWVGYMGFEEKVYVDVVENYVESIDYTPKNLFEYVEETNGRYIEDEPKYFAYDYYKQEGDILTVNYTQNSGKGTKTFEYIYDDKFGDCYKSNDGEIIKSYDVILEDDQENNHWTTNKENYITVKYKGITTQKKVTIKENPIQKIKLIKKKPIEIYEGANGYNHTVTIWNPETEEDEEKTYFCYTYSVFEIGDKLIVNDTEYEYKEIHNEEEDYYQDAFCSESGDILDDDYIYTDDNQSYYNQWKINGTNKITVSYMGREDYIFVTIKDNPVKSIEYKPANGGYKLIEDTNGYYDTDDNFFYYSVDFHQLGNILIVHSEEETKTYKFYYEGEGHAKLGYYTEDGKDFISIYDISINDNQYNNHWEKGKENFVTVEYLGKSVKVPVELVSNDVESIKYEAVSPYEIEENTGGFWDNITIDGKDTSVYIYNVELKDGDKLKVTKTDKTTETYEYKQYKDTNKCGFYNGNELVIHAYDGNTFYYYDDQYDGKLWNVGNDNYFTVWYKGKEAKVNVTILSKCKHEKTELKNAKEATCSSEGYTGDIICTECGETIKTGTKIAKLEHTPKSAVIENENPATCSKEGSYDEVVYCSVCNNEISRTVKSIAKLEHNYNTITTSGTLSTDGSIVEKCTVCGEVKTATSISYPNTISLSKTSFTYNKKVQKPTFIVKDINGNVIDSSNYTITYSNNNSKNVGEYTATITFKNNYTGTKTLNYTIKPKGTTLKKLTAGKKQFKAIWKAQKTQTTGYEIQYSTNKKFKSGNKKAKVKKNKTTSSTIKKLKAKKKYYVRIRTYKTVNGKKIYSDWSKAKKVTTKR